jgi:hypothetical protein
LESNNLISKQQLVILLYTQWCYFWTA